MGKTWYYRLLFSYLPILFIVVTFTFFVFFQLLSEQSRKEALGANKMLSLQAMRLVDTSLKAIDNMVMLEIINNKQLSDFFNAQQMDSDYLNIATVKKMQEMISSYPLIDSIYLVRFKDQYVLSNATNSLLSEYKDASFIHGYMDQSPLKQWTGTRKFQQFSVREGKQVVSLVRGAPFISGEKGLIVINVATHSLSDIIDDLYDPKTSFIRVRDGSGNGMFTDNEAVTNAKKFSNYVSSYTGWTYESGLINGQVVQIISSLYNVWFIVGIIMIILAFVWMIYITRRNSRPLEQIVARIRGYTLPLARGLNKEGEVDEFSFIESALENIIEQSNQFQQKHKEDMHLRTRYLFHRLIEGGTPLTNDEWTEEAVSLQLPYPEDLQVVLVAEMDHYGDFCRQYSRRDQNLLKFALRSIMREFAHNHSFILWCEWTSSSQLSCMVFRKSEEENGQRLLEMFENVRLWTQQNLKFTVTIGIGEPIRQLADIPMSFKGALEALKYKIVLGENRLINSDQIARHDQAEVYSHLNAIRSIVQSFRLLEDWRSGYGELFVHMKQGLLTKDEITNLMNYLIYSLGREMAAMNRDIQELWEREVLPKLSECLEVYQTLDQIREETERVLDSLSEYMAEAQAHRQYAVKIRDMRKYIEQHFMSPNISLDHLSDQFNISAKYISKLFKEETGQKFVDFLIDIRIKQAEKMLAETQTPVQEVAESVGYTSAISFSRVFKKVVGLSPSEYREEAARKQMW